MGQVATFMEHLHLSYHEVMDVIPYRDLLIMQRDKLHEVFGDVLEEVSDDDFFREKGMKFEE